MLYGRGSKDKKMKVICIDNTKPMHSESSGNFKLIEGHTYTDTEVANWYGYDWYLLKEDDGGNGWNPIYFIPLSETETEKIEYNYETAKA